ncbi:Condensin-2 complex subunit H2-like isoform X3 [Oopsacas minuta]|uniref:Condensin-2 complex subunit H2-like isoform X3 n=1 Tax=Oopsacas minuta TaxID=111878 RepID=A0AAV7KKF8_9METZ|nr:Condensin-2 complex subunit H2-like isoform X3 [Oopsacas minuta]
MTQSSDNQRFQQLLAPIRDLSENWNIDLASQLEEYLEEIEQVEITFDNGKTKIDFIEAALLIQGSTQVFSRKVEYLYSLVVQTLELLTNQKRPDTDNTSPHHILRVQHHAVVDILTLDDVPTRVSELKESAIKDEKLIPETPTVLLSTDCTLPTPLYSTSKELIGKRQDFHLLTATPHYSGTLLIEPNLAYSLEKEANIYDCTLMPEHKSPVYEEGGYDVSAYDSPIHGSPPTPQRSITSGSTRAPNTALSMMQSGPPLTADKTLQLASLSNNPFMTLLNPYDTPAGGLKPFKRGKCHRIPPNLMTSSGPGKRRRDVQPATCGMLDQLTDNLWSEKKHFPKNTLLRLSFLANEDMFWIEQKRRSDEAKKYQKTTALQRSRGDSSIPVSKFYSDLEPQSADCDSEIDEPDCLPDELPDDNEPDLLPQDVPDFDTEVPYLPSFNEQNDGAPQPGIAGYARKVRLYLDDVRNKAQKHAHNTALSTRVEEWRRFVSPLLEKEANETVFDIHESSQSLVSHIKAQENTSIKWSELTTGMQPHEKAGNFLTSLVLANNYNIQLDKDENGNVTLSLLNEKLAFEEVAHFVAPSLEN